MKTKANKSDEILVYLLLLRQHFFSRGRARFYANDSSDDSKVYAQIARNLLEQRTIRPRRTTLLAYVHRLPGYPLFLAVLLTVRPQR